MGMAGKAVFGVPAGNCWTRASRFSNSPLRGQKVAHATARALGDGYVIAQNKLIGTIEWRLPRFGAGLPRWGVAGALAASPKKPMHHAAANTGGTSFAAMFYRWLGTIKFHSVKNNSSVLICSLSISNASISPFSYDLQIKFAIQSINHKLCSFSLILGS